MQCINAYTKKKSRGGKGSDLRTGAAGVVDRGTALRIHRRTRLRPAPTRIRPEGDGIQHLRLGDEAPCVRRQQSHTSRRSMVRWSRLDGAVVPGSATRAAMRRGEVRGREVKPETGVVVARSVTRAAMRRGEVGGREVAPETGAVVVARWRGGCGIGDARRDAVGVGG